MVSGAEEFKAASKVVEATAALASPFVHSA